MAVTLYKDVPVQAVGVEPDMQFRVQVAESPGLRPLETVGHVTYE